MGEGGEAGGEAGNGDERGEEALGHLPLGRGSRSSSPLVLDTHGSREGRRLEDEERRGRRLEQPLEGLRRGELGGGLGRHGFVPGRRMKRDAERIWIMVRALLVGKRGRQRSMDWMDQVER